MIDFNELFKLFFAGGVAVILRELVAALKTRSDSRRQDRTIDFEALNRTILILQREIKRRQHEKEQMETARTAEVKELEEQIRQLKKECAFLTELNQQYLLMLRAEGVEI